MPNHKQTLVLLHGGAMSSASLRPIAGLLPRYRCLIPDLRGHGLNRERAFSGVAACATDLADYIAQKTDEPVHLFGLSLGGYAALHLMTQRKIRVHSAIISGISLQAPRARWLWKHMISVLYPLLGVRSLRTFAGRMAGIADTNLMSDAEGESWARPETVRDLAHAVLCDAPAEMMTANSVRTLFLAGSKEMSAVTGGLARLPDDCAQMKAGFVKDGSHGWCLNDPALASRVIEAWIERHPLPPQITPVRQGSKHP